MNALYPPPQVGWNVSYDFSESDFSVSLAILDQYLTQSHNHSRLLLIFVIWLWGFKLFGCLPTYNTLQYRIFSTISTQAIFTPPPQRTPMCRGHPCVTWSEKSCTADVLQITGIAESSIRTSTSTLETSSSTHSNPSTSSPTKLCVWDNARHCHSDSLGHSLGIQCNAYAPDWLCHSQGQDSRRVLGSNWRASSCERLWLVYCWCDPLSWLNIIPLLLLPIHFWPPQLNSPEVVGLHSNAEVRYLESSVRMMWADLISLQPRIHGGNESKTRDSVINQAAVDILAKVGLIDWSWEW